MNVNKDDIVAAATGFDLLFAGVTGGLSIATGGVTIYNAVIRMKEEEFNDKLRRFIQEDKDVTQDDREKFLKLLGNDVEEFKKRILLVLDELDEKEKATIVGKLFRALRVGNITMTEFRRLCKIVSSTFLETLNYLTQFEKESSSEKIDASRSLASNATLQEKRQLESLGLIAQSTEIVEYTNKNMSATDKKLKQMLKFELTQLGKKLCLYGLEPNPISLPFTITFRLPNNANKVFEFAIVDQYAIVHSGNEWSEEFLVNESVPDLLLRALTLSIENISEQFDIVSERQKVVNRIVDALSKKLIFGQIRITVTESNNGKFSVSDVTPVYDSGANGHYRNDAAILGRMKK